MPFEFEGPTTNQSTREKTRKLKKTYLNIGENELEWEYKTVT